MQVKKLLIVVDMQNDFVFGALGTKEAQSILPFVKDRIEAARVSGEEIVFTRDTHAENYLSTQEGENLPVPHCIKGTEGWQIVAGLHNGERVFDKITFGSLELAAYVQNGGYTQATLIGVCTDICVASNAILIKAAAPELPIFVEKACCAGVTPATHEAALVTLASCQVKIL